MYDVVHTIATEHGPFVDGNGAITICHCPVSPPNDEASDAYPYAIDDANEACCECHDPGLKQLTFSGDVDISLLKMPPPISDVFDSDDDTSGGVLPLSPLPALYAGDQMVEYCVLGVSKLDSGSDAGVVLRRGV